MNPNIASHNYLCHIISPLTDTQDIARLKNQMTRSEVSWERVIYLANTHLIISALWVGLCEKKLDSELENEVRNYLQELHTLNLRRNRGLKRQAIEAIEVLNKRGIVPMLIKGAVQLFQPVHRDFGVRIMVDLDILVPKGRIAEAIKALIQIGYQAHKDSNVDWEVHHHVAPLGRAGEYGSIELHRKALGNKIADQVLSTADIWATAEDCVTNGIRFKVPNATHAVLLGILHSQVTHGYHQRLVLDYKAMHDMVAMTGCRNKDVDWDQIRNRFTKHGLDSILRTQMWTAYRLFSFPMQNGMWPSAYTRAYHGLYLAMIRWEFVDKWFEKFFVFYKVRLKKRFGLLKQLLPLRLVYRKTNLED
jgi:hypothetical protein